MIPEKIEAPICQQLEIKDEQFCSERGGGILVFLPLIEKPGLTLAIRKSKFPKTSVINDVSSLMSFIALKLLGNERLSHDEIWNLDRAICRT